MTDGTKPGTLTVFLEKCTGLADKDLGGKSDPYVTLTLKKAGELFGSSDVAQYKSTVKKDNLSPIFRETFTFSIPSICGLTLHLSVKDEDIGKDDSLGECDIKLLNVPGLGEGKSCDVKAVVDSNFIAADAEVYVTLTYKNE